MSATSSKTMMRDLTEGSVPKLLLSFAAPLFLSNALQAIYNVVDMIVVGQVIGGTGMSAVSTGGNLLMMLNFVVMGYSSAGQILIAQDVGRKELDRVRKTIGTMFTTLLIAAAVLSVICYTLRDPILHAVNTPLQAYEYTKDYMVVCLSGLIFIYGYNIVSAIMRGMGDSKRPFMFVAIASVMNIILDILFVAVFRMEVLGAALATVIGQAFSFLYALYYLYTHRENFGFDFNPRSFRIDLPTLRRLSALGIPMALQSAAVTVSMTVVAAWINFYGVTASALSGILHKLGSMMGILSNSLTTAAGAMIGQNLGARKYKRVPQIMYWATGAAFLIQTAFVIVMLAKPGFVFGLFTGDPTILASAFIIITPCILNAYGAVGRTFGFSIINGSGNSRLNLLVAVLDGLIGRIGLAYLLGSFLHKGAPGYWLGDALAGYMPLMIGGFYYFSGMWKRHAEKQ